MGSCWVNVKSERQAWRLELQAEADPAILRQNFFFLQEASGFALRAFDWLDEATTVLSVISSTEVLMMDVSHIHKIPSRQHLDECLVESLDTGLPKLTQTADHHSTCQMFFSWKNPIFALWLLHLAVHLCLLWNTLSVGSKISEAYPYYVHDREVPGKKEYLLKSLKCKMPSPDL